MKNGLGQALCLFGNITFILLFHLKLHIIKESTESRKSLAKYVFYIIFCFFFVLATFTLFSKIQRSSVLIAHFVHFLSFTLFWIVLPKYYIHQSSNLKLYVKTYLHYPPLVLPWQLPEDFNPGSVILDVVKI